MGNTDSKQCSCTTSVNVAQTMEPVALDPVSTITTNPEETYSNFEQKMLDLHNTARIKNGLEPLIWDNALQQKASDWNNFLKGDREIALCSSMRHPGTGPDGSQEEIGIYLPNGNGQNLYTSHGLRPDSGSNLVAWDTSSPQESVRLWYDECRMWSPPVEGQEVPDKFDEVGHLTQMLWKDASRIGCSFIPCEQDNLTNGSQVRSKGHIINCHYDRGNVSGQFGEQVVPTPFCDSTGNKWILSESYPASSSAE